MTVNKYDGSAWQRVNQIQRGDGSDVTAVKKWDGSQWLTLWSSTTIIDDFEDGDITEYSGDTSSFAVQTATVSNGTYALQATADGVQIGDQSSLSALPVGQGDTFRFDSWIVSSGYSEFYWCTQSENDRSNSYNIVLDDNRSEFIIRKVDGGDFTVLASDAEANIPDSSWFDVEVDHQNDGTITATLFDSSGAEITSINATDTTHTNGGIAFRRTSGEQYWDYLRKVK